MEQIRVKNGYGFLTSTLSASVIGDFDASSEKRWVGTECASQRVHTLTGVVVSSFDIDSGVIYRFGHPMCVCSCAFLKLAIFGRT